MGKYNVWDAYLKAHPKAKKFRSGSLPHYQILDELCANLSATGEYAISTNLSFRSDFPPELSYSGNSQASQSQPATCSIPFLSLEDTPRVEITAVEIVTGGEREIKKSKWVAAEKASEEGDGVEEETVSVQKKIKTEWKTAGHAIAPALDRLGGTAQTLQWSNAELAVERVQADYSSILSTVELVKAFIVMENEVKASIFITLKAGEARDKWLQKAVNKV
ncbi:hypothetical protein HOY80DRAFT_1133150 [Tuber brumale]|nr:hypothetical protein HOY80DRAFT_1133150 [Tuber brumale]